MTTTPDTSRETHHHFLTGLAQQGDYAHGFAKAGHQKEALEHVAAIEGLTAAYRAAVGAADAEDVHTYFGLSYANYLVLPRTMLQSMPEGWQVRFVAMLNQLHDAFEHVPQAPTYQVTAGKTLQLNEMTESQLHAAGIDVEGDGEDGPGPGTRYHRRSDGAELTGDDYGFVPGKDPVPHYNRGRTRVEPRLGGGA
ncbi:hypothetical protein ACFYQT_40295 [Streptomyces tibetensis]|uniref:Uncharacterized protein n=1 Tax=Streptomyces tibetensis TaxID=2382123 RepID=A0ABW6N8K8_9ACTN